MPKHTVYTIEAKPLPGSRTYAMPKPNAWQRFWAQSAGMIFIQAMLTPIFLAMLVFAVGLLILALKE